MLNRLAMTAVLDQFQASLEKHPAETITLPAFRNLFENALTYGSKVASASEKLIRYAGLVKAESLTVETALMVLFGKVPENENDLTEPRKVLDLLLKNDEAICKLLNVSKLKINQKKSVRSPEENNKVIFLGLKTMFSHKNSIDDAFVRGDLIKTFNEDLPDLNVSEGALSWMMRKMNAIGLTVKKDGTDKQLTEWLLSDKAKESLNKLPEYGT